MPLICKNLCLMYFRYLFKILCRYILLIFLVSSKLCLPNTFFEVEYSLCIACVYDFGLGSNNTYFWLAVSLQLGRGEKRWEYCEVISVSYINFERSSSVISKGHKMTDVSLYKKCYDTPSSIRAPFPMSTFYFRITLYLWLPTRF